MPVYLAGHGGWNVINSKYPYAKVPRGTTISFYSENAKGLPTMSVAEIVSLSMDGLLGDSNGDFGEYKSCPNYTLYVDTSYKQGVWNALGCLQFPDGTPLCTGVGSNGVACMDSGLPVHTCNGIFADNRVAGNEVLWLACRSLQMYPMGGQAIGVNTGQSQIGTSGASTGTLQQNTIDKMGTLSPDDFWAWFLTLADNEQWSVLSIDPIAQQFAIQQRPVPHWIDGRIPPYAGWVDPTAPTATPSASLPPLPTETPTPSA
jgi:hypothetical protein